MAINKYTAGAIICSEGDPVRELYVIGTGTILASFQGGNLALQKGDIIGIQDIKNGTHSCTYTAQTDSALVPYPYTSFEGLLGLFTQKPEVMHLFFTAAARFSTSLVSYCKTVAQTAAAEKEQDSVPELGELPSLAPLPGTEPQSEPQTQTQPQAQAQPQAQPEAPAAEDIELGQEVLPIDESELPEELRDFLPQVYDFAGCDDALKERFTDEVESFKAMTDKESSEDKYRKLRMSLSKDYYAVYKAAFIATLADDVEVPKVVKLFLTFGMVDVELVGISNAVYLAGVIENYHGDPQRGVYTYPEWLRAIYDGRKEPSRNEFDLDYPAWLREQRSTGAINDKEMKELLNSRIDMVRFELDNVLPIVNKMTYGRITTFVPVLSEHTLLRALPDIIITPHKLATTVADIKKFDYSAYYRETSYVNEKLGIAREQLDIEVLPDFILAPNAGVRGAMWQEIEGKRRTTPSRMMLSIMGLEDTKKLVLRMTGEFRWEMCKRIQGAHWNNIAERSLTSEFCDYAQFYKRNHELSPEAKEKIKLQMTKCKNSMKELFISDYTSWISYESSGSPRLNKLSRAILFTYCPFPAEVRAGLSQHPLYSQLIERQKLKTAQKLHHLDMVQSKVEKIGAQMPVELLNQKAFLQL